MLKDYENLNRIFFVLAAAAGICLASSILFMVLNRALKKRRNAPPGPEGSHRIKHKPRTGQQQPTAPKVTAKAEPKAAPAEPKAVKTGVPAPEPAKSARGCSRCPCAVILQVRGSRPSAVTFRIRRRQRSRKHKRGPSRSTSWHSARSAAK